MRVLAAALVPLSAIALFAEDAADKTTFQKVCGACHAASMIKDLRTEAEWADTVDQMIEIGAKGTSEQFGLVMHYLVRNLTKVNVNTGTAVEIAPVLDIPETVAQAIVEFRGQHGAFKTLDDLKKVPGVSEAKLIARKDRIAF